MRRCAAERGERNLRERARQAERPKVATSRIEADMERVGAVEAQGLVVPRAVHADFVNPLALASDDQVAVGRKQDTVGAVRARDGLRRAELEAFSVIAVRHGFDAGMIVVAGVIEHALDNAALVRRCIGRGSSGHTLLPEPEGGTLQGAPIAGGVMRRSAGGRGRGIGTWRTYRLGKFVPSKSAFGKGPRRSGPQPTGWLGLDRHSSILRRAATRS